MAIYSLTESANAELLAAHQIPFCRQPNKGMNTFFNDAFCIIKGAFLYVFSNTGAEYQFLRGKQIEKWSTFGDRLVDFAMNHTNIPPQPGDTEWERFQTTYGLENFSWQPNLGLFDRNRLALKSEGFCGGTSAHFIYSYLMKLRSGTPPREAIETISPMYRDGPPKSAQIAHILSEAYDCKDIIDEKTESFLNTQNIIFLYCSYLFHCVLDLIKRAAKAVCAIFGFQIEMEERANGDFEEFASNALKTTLLEIVENKPQYQLFGIRIKAKIDLQQNEYSSENLDRLAQTLLPGVYDIFLLPGENTIGHSIVFIKTGEEENFFFDSNSGTFIGDSAEELWQLSEQYYPESDGGCQMTFWRCELD